MSKNQVNFFNCTFNPKHLSNQAHKKKKKGQIDKMSNCSTYNICCLCVFPPGMMCWAALCSCFCPGQKHSSSPHICFPLALACKAQTHTSSHNFPATTETVSARQKAEKSRDKLSTPLASQLWRSFTVTPCLPRHMLTSSDLLRDLEDRDKYVKKKKRTTTDLSSSRTTLASFFL